jgi:hypothetical protein
MAWRARRYGFAAALTFAATSCLYGWDLPSATDVSEAGAGDATGSDAASEGGDSPLDDAASEGAGPDVPNPRGCTVSSCSPGSFCKFPIGQCGSAEGVCATLPQCDPGDGYTMWCTCAGLVKSECDALRTGGGLKLSGCGADPSFFQCGYLYCLRKNSACVSYPADGTYACIDALSIGCVSGPEAASCPCAKSACDGGAAALCADTADGGPTITCK